MYRSHDFAKIKDQSNQKINIFFEISNFCEKKPKFEDILIICCYT